MFILFTLLFLVAASFAFIAVAAAAILFLGRESIICLPVIGFTTASIVLFTLAASVAPFQVTFN